MKNYYFIILSLFALLISSCSNKEKGSNATIEDRPLTIEEKENSVYQTRTDENMTRSSGDTLSIYTITKDYLEELKNNNLDTALGMLYEYNLGQINPLPNERKIQLRALFTSFPILGYKIDDIKLLTDVDNELKYSIRFRDIVDGKDDSSNYISFMLNPVRIKGQWYLTIDEYAKGPLGGDE